MSGVSGVGRASRVLAELDIANPANNANAAFLKTTGAMKDQ